MKLQQLLSYVRKAVEDYDMIQSGDRIAIGISGGKDSLTLLHALSELQRFFPQEYSLHAISVDLGFKPSATTESLSKDYDNNNDDDANPFGTESGNWEQIEALCRELDVPYEIIMTDIADVVFTKRQETNPCSLCAKMRKGALNEAAKKLGINKIAYGHHQNDAVETMLLSLLYEGRIHTFAPVTYLDRMDVTVIRPLIYLEEANVIGFVRKHALPVMKSPCPVDGHTKREYVKELIHDLAGEHPGIYKKMFTAIKHSQIEGWSPARETGNDTEVNP
ncbi:MAG: tRNA 2-thiocytidine(32) synthetase TtcA [Lachnospiraceae bacterium]|jgi:tRNA(Ile)-lysidine synthase TilS/MesJ|nr:tRNA 2-thiocytidine(32) synthetase TtcA [Lachnospiraceae bacterium]